MDECDVSEVSWDVPQLSGGFTSCDMAHAFNSSVNIALVALGLIVFSLAIIAFKGR